MKFAVNKKEGSPRLLICFLGWASGSKTLDGFDIEGYDIVSIYDYRDANLDDGFLDVINGYKEVSILAWSFGVFVAEQMSHKLPPLTLSLAVNGTPVGASPKYGIHPRTLELTIKNLDIDKFYERMCGEDYPIYVPSGRSLDELRDELIFLYDWFKIGTDVAIEWGGAIIGEKDFIFPYKNMLHYWQENTTFVVLESCPIPHYPFGRLGVDKIKRFYCGG